MQPIELLYLSGLPPIDELIEQRFQGEDVYVELVAGAEYLTVSLAPVALHIAVGDIECFRMPENEGLLVVVLRGGEELVFAYGERLSYDFLSFCYGIDVRRDFPPKVRMLYVQMKDVALFKLLEHLKDDLPPHPYIHFHDTISEEAYGAIIDSFAPEAVDEVPLLYVKYADTGTQELGLLVTYFNLYAPEGCMRIRDIERLEIEEIFLEDSLKLVINGTCFTKMKMVIHDSTGLPFSFVKKVFPVKEFELMFQEITNHLIINSS